VVPTCWPVKVSVAGASVAVVGPAVPVPLSATVCVVPTTPPALSVIVIVPVRGPTAEGVIVTPMVQTPFGGTTKFAVQVVFPTAAAKSLPLGPLKETGVAPIVKLAPSELVFATVTVKLELVVFTI